MFGYRLPVGHIGIAELIILGGLFAVFVIPLVALVAWALLRGRKKPE